MLPNQSTKLREKKFLTRSKSKELLLHSKSGSSDLRCLPRLHTRPFVVLHMHAETTGHAINKQTNKRHIILPISTSSLSKKVKVMLHKHISVSERTWTREILQDEVWSWIDDCNRLYLGFCQTTLAKINFKVEQIPFKKLLHGLDLSYISELPLSSVPGHGFRSPAREPTAAPCPGSGPADFCSQGPLSSETSWPSMWGLWKQRQLLNHLSKQNILI